MTNVSANSSSVGVATSTASLANSYYVGRSATSYGYKSSKTAVNNASTVATYVTYTSGDVIGVAVDLTAGKVWWRKNGAWQGGGDPGAGTGGVSLAAGAYFPSVSVSGGEASTANFGASAFNGTIPTEFAAWNSAP